MTNPPPTAVGAVPPWAAVWLQQPLELSLPPLGGSALYTFGRGSHSRLGPAGRAGALHRQRPRPRGRHAGGGAQRRQACYPALPPVVATAVGAAVAGAAVGNVSTTVVPALCMSTTAVRAVHAVAACRWATQAWAWDTRRGRGTLGVGVAGVAVHMESYEDHTSRQCTWSHTRTT